MKTITILALLVALSSITNAQKIHRKCGPAKYLATRTFVQNASLNSLPYSAIVHVNCKGWGTASFISDSMLITARHVADKWRLKSLELYKNSFANGTVVTTKIELNQNDFTIKNVPADTCHFISTDISFIKLSQSGKMKVSAMYSGCFNAVDCNTLNLKGNQEVTLTGYPVDLASSGINNSDILADKKTVFKELRFEQCPMVGYKIFTCSGDSGAPLWVELNGNFYLIGIHHGGPEGVPAFNVDDRNSAALINTNILSFQ